MSYRQFERLPAREYALRFERTHRQLRTELSMPEPERTFIETPGKYSGAWLVFSFGLGVAFWIGLGAIFM